MKQTLCLAQSALFRLFAVMSLCVLVLNEQRSASTLLAQQRTNKETLQAATTLQKNDGTTVLPRIQDDFADLDDTLQVVPGLQVNERFVTTTLESARQQYLRALSYINRSDTARAARSFDQAIETLNKISDYPKIQDNQDFMDLMQSIIEDYENYIRNLDNLSDKAQIVVLRDKFFQSVENPDMPSYEDLNFPRGKDSSARQFQALKLPESSSALATFTGMRGVKLQVAMPENQEVLWAIEFLAVRGRRYFQKWIERTGKWFTMMRKIAREEGAPEEIIYLSMIESGLSPQATSWAKAVGLWQFIKGTGQMYGLGADYWRDERRDPEKATRAAMRYLKDLYNELGDWHLALAAYNCGPGGVRRAIARSGIQNPSYWDIRPFLPKETRNYVPLYVAASKVCMNPEAYGFTSSQIQFEERYNYETVPVNEAADFKVLARAAGVGEETLRDLNPELINYSTPPYSDNYQLKIPVGTKSTFVANYDKMSQSDKHSWTMHEVTGSETLWSIARKYNVPSSVIAAANDITGRRKRVSVGTMLRIPTDGRYNAKSDADEDEEDDDENTSTQAVTSSTTRQSSKDEEKRKEQPSSKSDEKALAKAETKSETKGETKAETKSTTEEKVQHRPAPIPENSKKITHSVKDDETLYSISARYNVRMSDLRNWNDIPYNSDKVSEGAELTLYVDKNFRPEDANKKPAVKQGTVQHTVARGETLAQIADSYGVTIDDLRRFSSMSKHGRIYVGQVLTVPVEFVESKPTRSATEEGDKKVTEPKSSVASTTAAAGGKAIVYKVQKGETLADIANRYNVTQRELSAWNQLRGNYIRKGMDLVILSSTAEKGSETPSQEDAASQKTYTVREGDTLFSISRKFGIKQERLKELNKELESNTVRLGQILRLQ
ncbi:MAG: LysM peptidoglycan-binding domain-containing protein [Candidatus Kapaibacterium sp.]|nr:MAG: LysM peptidoglycan-binding domain-containing protein [Candidatus Kapabacteria bacterium]